MDVLIAATALAEGETRIVTRNPAHHEAIPGMRVLDYSPRFSMLVFEVRAGFCV